jgi:protein involved in polysaccharide export with SLBB domain
MWCLARTCSIAVLLLTLGPTGCSSPSRSIPPEAAVTGTATPGGTAAETAGDAGVEGYVLGPGDQLRLTVFRHEDLSGEFELDGEGYFAMPLIGEILAGGMPARAIETEIESRLEDGGYLVEPQVSVEVLNYRPFYIIGEVNNPGSYQYVSGMNVVNAVALAGGFTYRADQDDIIITRGGSNGEEMDAELTSGVLPGDIIEVTERFF